MSYQENLDKLERDAAWHGMDYEHQSYCPACGQPIDYCQGHGEMGDPDGYAILAAHDDDNHKSCDPRGCDETTEDE